MTQRPAEDTTSTGGNGDFIFQTRKFDDSGGASFSNYSQVIRTSTYGHELELWNNTEGWIADDFSSPEFGVEFSFTPTNTSGARVTVHAIRVTVCYELAGSKGTVSGVAGNGLLGVTRKGPVDVCCGVQGRIFTSNDAGQNWTERTSNVTEDLEEVSYRNGEYIAVGKNGAVTTSPDGTTWTRQNIGTGQDLFAIMPDGPKLVIGGTNEELLAGATLTTLEFGRTVDDPYVDPNA